MASLVQTSPFPLSPTRLAPANPSVTAVLSQALAAEQVDHLNDQRRLEAQVQQGEIKLFQTAKRADGLARQLTLAQTDANQQRTRVEQLELELAAETQERTRLAALLTECQGQVHTLTSELQSTTHSKNLIQERLAASEVRIQSLIEQIAQERTKAVRNDHLNALRVQKMQLEHTEENGRSSLLASIAISTLAGTFLGGPVGAAFGFVHGLVGAVGSLTHEGYDQSLTQLRRVNEEIAQLQTRSS